MNFIDILFMIPIIYGIYTGFKNGFIIEICTLLALLVGLYAGIHFSDGTAELLVTHWDFTSEYLPVIAFTITFLAIGALIYFGGKMLEKAISVANLSPLNKFLGILFALIKVLYFLSAFVVILESYDEKGDFIQEETKDESLLYKPVKNISLKTIPSLKESALFLKEAMTDTTETSTMSLKEMYRAKQLADSLGIDAEDIGELKEIYLEYEKKEN